MKCPKLDEDEIKNEFEKADINKKNYLSKNDIDLYVSKLFCYICEIIYSEFSKTIYQIKSINDSITLLNCKEKSKLHIQNNYLTKNDIEELNDLSKELKELDFKIKKFSIEDQNHHKISIKAGK